MEKILVVGAGIAGLALAKQLKKFNIPFVLIEKRKNLSPVGAGIALPANAVKALRYLELGEKIDQHAHRVREIVFTQTNGTLLSRASLLEPPLNHDCFVALERAKLHDILLEGLETEIYLDTTIKNINIGAENISVEFKSDSLKYENFSAIIGADGIHSGVRSFFLKEEQATKQFPYTMWRWMSQYATKNLQPTYMIGSGEVFMVYPVGEEEVYCYANIWDRENFYSQLEPRQLLIQHFSHYGSPAQKMLSLLSENTSIISGRMCVMKEPVLKLHERIVLTGDAAHGCTPAFQQGAGSALEDVIVLAELLHRYSVKEAFEFYVTLRSERIKWISASSNTSTEKSGHTDHEFITKRFENIRQNGPTNVQGWRKLFAMPDPLLELKIFLGKKYSTF